MPAEPCMQRRSRFVGLPREGPPQPVSMPRRVVPVSATVPQMSYTQVHSPVAASSSEFLVQFSRSQSFDPSIPTQGLSPLRGITEVRLLREGCHASTIVPSTGFLSLSTTFSALSALRVYFASLPRSGFTPFRGFSPSAAALPHRKAVPPCRSTLTSSPDLSPAARCERLDFEALLHARQRSPRFGVSRPVSRSPLRFSLLQVVSVCRHLRLLGGIRS